MERIKCLAKLEVPDGTVRARWDNNTWFLTHTHDFWEFPVIVKGNYKQELNGVIYPVAKKQAILISPNHLHKTHPSESAEDCCINIIINRDFFKRICHHFSPTLYDEFLNATPQAIQLSDSKMEIIQDFVNKIELLGVCDEALPVKKMLVSFIIELVYHGYFASAKDYPKYISAFIQKASLPENFALDISELIVYSGYSYSHFSKLFKQATGTSIKRFLTEKKMDYASRALLQNDSSILQLSSFLGFDSLSHFITIFKKYFGVTPSKYRNEYKTQN